MSDTLILLVVAGLALVFKFLARQAARGEDTPPPQSPGLPNERSSPPAVTRPPAQSEEERVRRFLEALGAPPGSTPPPPVQPRVMGPRRVITPARQPKPKLNRPWAQPLPPLVTVPGEERLTTPPAPVIPSLPSVPTSTLLPPAPSPRALKPAGVPTTSPAVIPPNVWLREMLRARGAARQAIVLREVLGLPRGLQPIEF